MTRAQRCRGISLVEILIAFLILLVAVLTMVGYTTTIHKAASEGKRQALASMEARSMLERIRDFPGAFDQANTPAGLTDTKAEYLLEGEADTTKNEAGRKSAAQFHLTGKVRQVEGEVFAVAVTAEWDEDGRHRQVVLESRMVRNGY
jgi:type IV pilus modification protein PilV